MEKWPLFINGKAQYCELVRLVIQGVQKDEVNCCEYLWEGKNDRTS